MEPLPNKDSWQSKDVLTQLLQLQAQWEWVVDLWEYFTGIDAEMRSKLDIEDMEDNPQFVELM